MGLGPRASTEAPRLLYSRVMDWTGDSGLEIQREFLRKEKHPRECDWVMSSSRLSLRKSTMTEATWGNEGFIVLTVSGYSSSLGVKGSQGVRNLKPLVTLHVRSEEEASKCMHTCAEVIPHLRQVRIP